MVSLDDYYQTIILIVGTGGSEAKKTAENQRTLVKFGRGAKAVNNGSFHG